MFQRLGRLLPRPLQVWIHRTVAARNLRRLYDILDKTEFSTRYWVTGGMLLGWAREGGIIAHDAWDMDFLLLEEDLPYLEAAIGELSRAGFRTICRYPGATGQPWLYSFMRQNVRFDFNCVRTVGDEFRCYRYGSINDEMVEAEFGHPIQEIVEFEYLGRVWRKPHDHEAELTVLYGDWRTPVVDWNYMEAPNVVAYRPWSRA